MNILFVASEAVPFAKTGGLADVVGILPRVMAAKQTVSLIIPEYSTEGIRGLELRTIDSFTLAIGSRLFQATIKKADMAPRFTVYFVAQEAFFAREFLYGDSGGDYPDNFLRFFFFQKAVVEFVQRRKLFFDVIHSHDWQAALIPLLVKLPSAPPFLQKSKTIFSIHNLGYQGIFDGNLFEETGLPEHFFSPEYLEFYGKLNFMKAGIIFSDWLLTVSPTYAGEILRSENGFGLDGLLNKFSFKLSGILNGADYGQWNPEIDPFIDHPYSCRNPEIKSLNKQALYRELGIGKNPRAPLLIMIARISEQKGMRLLVELLPVLLKENLHFVFLGCGDGFWTEKLQETAARFPENFTFLNRFDERMAHRLEAAADLFFMPSLYEPCGLNQLYSLKYGTVPVVRATGGLEDSVTEFDAAGGGSGFKFSSNQAADVAPVIRKAIRLYQDADAWRRLQQNGMLLDFSWEKVVREYIKLYNKILGEDGNHG
ncbi:MAG: glycogen/starch synthase [Candidatus Aminicenantes bacterium]|nr:glycogen/starch synthase [Candidatus Aminicenantes bacterium]